MSMTLGPIFKYVVIQKVAKATNVIGVPNRINPIFAQSKIKSMVDYQTYPKM